MKNWQERFFVIFDSSELEYYKGVKSVQNPTDVPDYKKGDYRVKISVQNCSFSLETKVRLISLTLRMSRVMIMLFVSWSMRENF